MWHEEGFFYWFIQEPVVYLESQMSRKSDVAPRDKLRRALAGAEFQHELRVSAIYGHV